MGTPNRLGSGPERRISPATTIELIARAVIRHDGSLLLARDHTTSSSFLPGGHVEPAERVQAALVRELAEELGTGARIGDFVCAVEHGYVEHGVAHHGITSSSKPGSTPPSHSARKTTWSSSGCHSSSSPTPMCDPPR
ncbi:MAG: NUDIX domain-containing protein [Thermocrispum sp.]